jgi:hypothetical protein
MKGMVFTEFLEMVEDKFSAAVVENIIDASTLPSEGVYTALGTYDHAEIIQLVSHLSEKTGIAVPALVQSFGDFLFGQLSTLYPQFFDGVSGSFDLLERVNDYIHVEVKKLYPDAELPSFRCDRPAQDVLTMHYLSSRPFADLAEGMIRGCIDHFGERIAIQREDMPGAAGTAATFTLTRQV